MITSTSITGGFPDRVRVRLKYVTNVSMSPSGVTAVDYVFRGNGPFDPDVTGVGSQPNNYDDWSAIYSRQRTYASTFSWCIANSASGSNDMSSFVVGPRHTSTAQSTLSSQENFQSLPYTQYHKTIIYRNGTSSTQGTMTMSTQKFLGMSHTEFAGNEDLTSLTTTTPSHQWFWHLCMSMDDQVSSCIHYVNFVVTYDIEFWDRVDTTLDAEKKADLLQRLRGPRPTASAAESTSESEPGVYQVADAKSASGPANPGTPAGGCPHPHSEHSRHRRR